MVFGEKAVEDNCLMCLGFVLDDEHVLELKVILVQHCEYTK